LLDVESILSRNNPKLSSFDYESPLSVGNGRFAFTVDVTGLQTFASEYKEKGTPLCTMSEWGWNSELLDHSPHRYQLSDLEMTKYQFDGREVVYPVERTSANQEVYDWLRHNPHKFNLARISFIWQSETIDKKWITQIDQELDLYRGRLMSKFMIKDVPVYVETVVGQEEDVLSIKVESKALETKDLAIKFSFHMGVMRYRAQIGIKRINIQRA